MKKKIFLSMLWLAAALNYAFRFLFSLYWPERLQQLSDGNLHGMPVTQGLLLALSIMMEIPIAMILLSCLLKRRSGRVLNILVALAMAAIHFLSMSAEGVSLHFYFFSTVGLLLYFAVILTALRWKAEPETGTVT